MQLWQKDGTGATGPSKCLLHRLSKVAVSHELGWQGCWARLLGKAGLIGKLGKVGMVMGLVGWRGGSAGQSDRLDLGWLEEITWAGRALGKAGLVGR